MPLTVKVAPLFTPMLVFGFKPILPVQTAVATAFKVPEFPMPGPLRGKLLANDRGV